MVGNVARTNKETTGRGEPSIAVSSLEKKYFSPEHIVFILIALSFT
jgi:hypothetical protein